MIFFVRNAPETENNKELSSEELMALERDAKRRRIKYKSVYTNHKSHTEVMREVIDTQMESFEDWVKDKCNLEEKKVENDQTRNASPSSHGSLDMLNERSTVSRNSTHSGSSKSTNRKYESSSNHNDRNKRHNRRSDHEDDNRDYQRDKKRYRSRSRERRSRHRRHSRDHSEFDQRKNRYDRKRNGFRCYN